MELRQLTALVTVADVGRVTKAAAVLHVAQPAVTRQIRLLEDELGVALFTRTSSGMVPTAEGRLMVDRARRALAEIERGRAEVRPNPGHLTGLVGVGLLESAADVVAPRLLTHLRTKQPGIRIRLTTAYSGHLRSWLEAGDVELSLLYDLESTSSLAVYPLVREGLWAVGSPSAPGAAECDQSRPLAWGELWRRPLVLPVPGHGLRVLIDQGSTGIGPPPDLRVEVNSLALQKKLIVEESAWSVLPAVAVARDIAAGRLVGAPLAEPQTLRTVVLALARGGRVGPPVEAVAAALARTVKLLVEDGTWPGEPA